MSGEIHVTFVNEFPRTLYIDPSERLINPQLRAFHSRFWNYEGFFGLPKQEHVKSIWLRIGLHLFLMDFYAKTLVDLTLVLSPVMEGKFPQDVKNMRCPFRSLGINVAVFILSQTGLWSILQVEQTTLSRFWTELFNID